jgi:hypothetical protein
MPPTSPFDLEITARVKRERVVKERLKAPATARFPSVAPAEDEAPAPCPTA